MDEAPGTLYWAVPTNGDGSLPEWKHLDVSDLPASGLARRVGDRLGPNAIIVGGTTADGVRGQRVRANLAPQAPFFQLGLVGATVPALKIDGEIGQQLGYLNANTVGIVNFVILLVVGWAFAHREQIRGWRERRRAPAPRRAEPALAGRRARPSPGAPGDRPRPAPGSRRTGSPALPGDRSRRRRSGRRSSRARAGTPSRPPSGCRSAQIISSGRSFGSSAVAGDELRDRQQDGALDPRPLRTRSARGRRRSAARAAGSAGGAGSAAAAASRRRDRRDRGRHRHRAAPRQGGGSAIEASAGRAARRASAFVDRGDEGGDVEPGRGGRRGPGGREPLAGAVEVPGDPRGLPRTPWTNAGGELDQALVELALGEIVACPSRPARGARGPRRSRPARRPRAPPRTPRRRSAAGSGR